MPDSKGKLGLAGKGVGASLELLFDAGDIIAHDRFHTLRLEAVHSYEHMGTFSVAVAAVEATLLAPPKTDGGLPEWKCSPWPAAGELVGTVQADCLWEMRQSTVEVTDVVFAQPNNNSCLRVLVRVVESAPARVENAVKLVAVTLF